MLITRNEWKILTKDVFMSYSYLALFVSMKDR